MGAACTSGEVVQTSLALSSQSEKGDVPTILLLGASEAGKTTLCQQLDYLYGERMKEPLLTSVLPLIHNNVVKCVTSLSAEVVLSPEAAKAREVLMAERDKEMLDQAGIEALSVVWEDRAVQHAYHHRDDLAHAECTFAGNVFLQRREVLAPDYEPTRQDLYVSYVRTSGLASHNLRVGSTACCLLDVGGLRSERKKWIHLMKSPKRFASVMFVVDVSSYSQSLFEESSQNRLLESIKLFHEVANAECFRESEMVLVMNKLDLLGDKLEQSPITATFPDYEGANTVDQVINYIQKLLMSKVSNRHVKVRKLSAIDTESVITSLDDSFLLSLISTGPA